MTQDDLKKAINGIDEKYIKEAAEMTELKVSRNVIITRVATAAAVIAALLLAATPVIIKFAGTGKHSNNDNPAVSGMPGTPTSAAELIIDASNVAKNIDYSGIDWVDSLIESVVSNNNGFIADLTLDVNDTPLASNNEAFNSIVRASNNAVYVSSVPVYTYDYENGKIASSVLLCMYDVAGNGVCTVEVTEGKNGLNYSKNSAASLKSLQKEPDSTFIYIEIDGSRYMLDKNNNLYHADTGILSPITVKGDMYKALNDGKLGVTYKTITSNNITIGCIDSHKLKLLDENIMIDIFQDDEQVHGYEAYSKTGRYASITRINNSWEFLLEVKGGEKDVSIELGSCGMGVDRVRWMDEHTFWGIMHDNPSLETLVEYNDETGVNFYYGLFFTRDQNGNLYYVSPTSHFSQEGASERILDAQGNVIFATEPGVQIVRYLAVSDDYVAFYTGKFHDDSDQNGLTLVVFSRKDNSVVLEVENCKVGQIVINEKE